MQRPLCHALDWLAIQIARRSPQRGVATPDEPARVLELLAHSDFFSDDVSPVAIEFSGERHYSFPTPLPCPWARNNLVRGRIYRSGEDWMKRPVVILLHGWNGELNYETLFPLMGRKLAAEGVTAMSLLLPYHGSRKPAGPGSVRNFICDDIGCVLAAARQSIADARALIRWLHAQGCPKVGVFGLSFGAWLAGLLAARERLIKYVILGTPINRIDRALRTLAFCGILKEKLEALGTNVEQFDLARQNPLLAPDRILLLESQYDLFAPAETVEELWEAWRHPEIWRVPHGHISVLLSAPVMRRVCGWIIRQSVLEDPVPRH